MSEPITSYHGRGLGRRVEHDEASKGFRTRFAAAKVVSKLHRHYGPPLDQGHLGSCTGNAAAQLLNTSPLRVKGKPLLAEPDAIAFYSLATQLDEFEGTYPPDDSGSSGLGVAKALLQLGRITRYEHAFSLDEALSTLGQHPVITGVPWYEGMFNPDASGFVKPTGGVAGGHEFLVRGVNVKGRFVQCVNSWGTSWGVKGEFRMSWDTWGRLLSEDGDVTVPLREAA